MLGLGLEGLGLVLDKVFVFDSKVSVRVRLGLEQFRVRLWQQKPLTMPP